jgi:ParB family chromosome partitioning protein
MSTPNKSTIARLPGAKKRPDDTVRTLLAAKDLDISRNTEAFNIPIEKLVPNPDQPRQIFKSEEDEELFESIKQQGILQPIIARKQEDGKYQIVAGERRYRAALRAEFSQVPVIIKEYDDDQVRVVSLLENIQRANLDPVDEQRIFLELQNKHNFSISEIANLINKSRNYVRQRLEGELLSIQKATTHKEAFITSMLQDSQSVQSDKLQKNSQSPVKKITDLRLLPSLR